MMMMAVSKNIKACDTQSMDEGEDPDGMTRRRTVDMERCREEEEGEEQR